MARRPRPQCKNGWYHVMNRGAASQSIYLNRGHRRIFLDLLHDITEIYNVEIHAYCLMTNHYHLLIKTPEANLSKAMKYLNQVYVQRFNKSECVDGPLFRGRFHSKVIKRDCYLIHLNRYIHYNAVDANIVDHPAKYPWSSYRAYIGVEKVPNWLKTETILGYFGSTPSRKGYQKFICEGNGEEIQEFFSGYNKEIREFLKNIKFKKSESLVKTRGIANIEEVIQVVSQKLDTPVEDIIISVPGKRNIARNIVSYICFQHLGYELRDICMRLGHVRPNSLSMQIKKVRSMIEEDQKFKEILQQCLNGVRTSIDPKDQLMS